jgi:hypothetical protein
LKKWHDFSFGKNQNDALYIQDQPDQMMN